MSDLLHERTITARVTHRCGYCRVRIQPGTRYRRSAWVDAGQISDRATCLDCTSLWQTVWDWVGQPWDEGIWDEDFRAWALDHPDTPAAAAWLRRARGDEEVR